MPTPIVDLLQRSNRGTLDHSKVLIVYDTSDTGDNNQEDIANAYRDAWGLPLPLYGVDLSASTSRNQVSMWSAWMSGLATYCETNGVQAICAPTTFGDSSGYLYARGESGSAIATLGCIKAIKAIMDDAGGSELSDNDALIEAVTENGATRLDYSGSTLLVTNLAETGDLIGGYASTSPLHQQKYAGMEGLFTSANSVVLEDEVSYSGVPFSSFLNATDTSLDSQKREVAQSCYTTDDLTLLRGVWYLPCWRIGWVTGAENAPQFTVEDCIAMVERSKAAKKSISYHTSRSIALVGANDRASSQALQPSNYCVFDAMCTDLGFDTKIGYAAEGTTIDRLDQVATDTGLTKYDSANVDFRQTNEAAGSGNTYRELNGGDTQLFAMNGNTFPMENVLLAFDTTVVNQSYDINNDWYSGENQGVSLSTGAIGTEGTSSCEGKAAAFILNGGSAFYGAIGEPASNVTSVNNGTAFMTGLLRGWTAADSMRFLNGYQIHFMELIGDGLAQPFAQQATEGQTSMLRSQFTAPLSFSQTGGTMQVGVGLHGQAEDIHGLPLRHEILNNTGDIIAVIEGIYARGGKIDDLNVVINGPDTPGLDYTNTTNDWPSWLTIEITTNQGTQTLNSSTNWLRTNFVNDGIGYAVYQLETDPDDPDMILHLTSGETGVDTYTQSGGADGTSTSPTTLVVESVGAGLYDGEEKYLYNYTDRSGPLRIESTDTNTINGRNFTGVTGNADTIVFTDSDVLVVTNPVTFRFLADVAGGSSTETISRSTSRTIDRSS